MKIDDLIEKLVEYRAQYGNVDVDADDPNTFSYDIKDFTVFRGIGDDGADLLTIELG